VKFLALLDIELLKLNSHISSLRNYWATANSLSKMIILILILMSLMLYGLKISYENTVITFAVKKRINTELFIDRAVG